MRLDAIAIGGHNTTRPRVNVIFEVRSAASRSNTEMDKAAGTLVSNRSCTAAMRLIPATMSSCRILF